MSLDYDVTLRTSAIFRRDALVSFLRAAELAKDSVMRVQIRLSSDEDSTDGEIVILGEDGGILVSTKRR